MRQTKFSLFNKWGWENSHMQTMTLDYSLTPYTKMKFKSIEDLNVRPEIMKLLEKSTRRKFLDIALEDDFVVVVVVVVLQLSQFPPIALPYPPPSPPGSYSQSLHLFLDQVLPLLSLLMSLLPSGYSHSLCSLFPCLCFYFAHLFVLFIRFLFFKVYFIDYTITVVSFLFSPFSPSVLHHTRNRIPCSLSSCPWVIYISSLAPPFPMLFLTSPYLFCTYHLCFVFPFPPFSSSLPPPY